MIRASDLLLPPLAGTAMRPVAALGSASAAAAAAQAPSAAWFDDEVPGADGRIGIGLDAQARGLSVAGHAERVLQHLRVDT